LRVISERRRLAGLSDVSNVRHRTPENSGSPAFPSRRCFHLASRQGFSEGIFSESQNPKTFIWKFLSAQLGKEPMTQHAFARSRLVTTPRTLIALFLVTATAVSLLVAHQRAEAIPPRIPDMSTARVWAAGLPVSGDDSTRPYSPSEFGGWVQGGPDCNTRIAVLHRDAEIDPSLPAGTGTGSVNVDCTGGGRITAVGDMGWYSKYDGTFTKDPSKVDIDHIVPRADAWRSGAWAWSRQQRIDFSNDLANAQLIAVSASSNRSKGDKDPASWMPPSPEWWCSYLGAWVAVKVQYGLAVDQAEKTALVSKLNNC
jgi:Protein of unknown function (DUF1524)